MEQPEEFDACARRLKSVADPDRLRIVTTLFEGPLNVTELSERLGEEVVKVSHHLGVLRNAGVVSVRKSGRFAVYSLHPDVTVSDELPGIRRIELGCCRLDLTNRNGA